MGWRAVSPAVAQPVDVTDPEGIDYGWVVQTTFVVSILVGFPVAGVLSTTTPLPTWSARLVFAIRVGAVVWLLVGLAVLASAKVRQS